MRAVARAIYYGYSNKLIAEKLKRTVSWVRLVQSQPRFDDIMTEVEADILRTSDRSVSRLWEKSIKTISKLMDSRSEKMRLEAALEAREMFRFQQGLGAGGVGAALPDPGEDSDEEMLLSAPAIQAAFKILDSTPEDDDYVDVDVLEEIISPIKK